MDVYYCRALLYALPNKGLVTKNLSPREDVYRVVAQQLAYALQYFYLDFGNDIFFYGWCVILRIKELLD
jgi:hypothetical protein